MSEYGVTLSDGRYLKFYRHGTYGDAAVECYTFASREEWHREKMKAVEFKVPRRERVFWIKAELASLRQRDKQLTVLVNQINAAEQVQNTLAEQILFNVVYATARTIRQATNERP